VNILDYPSPNQTVDSCPKLNTAAAWHARIRFVDPHLACRRSATFLPEVAREQGWSVRDTLVALVAKSGYKGRVDSTLLADVSLTRYQSSVSGMTWAQYQDAMVALVAGRQAAAAALRVVPDIQDHVEEELMEGARPSLVSVAASSGSGV
jgi:hypothetical protein